MPSGSEEQLMIYYNEETNECRLFDKETGRIYSVPIEIIENRQSIDLQKLYKINGFIEIFRNNIKQKTVPIRKYRSPQLRMLYLEITGRCNLRCKHCYASNLNTPKKISQELTLDKYLQILNNAVTECGTHYIQLSGGEILTVPEKTISVITHARKLGLYVPTVFSNGTLITYDTASKLKKIGIGSITISLDGHNKKTHEALRGKGTFDRTLNSIKILSEVGIRVRINTVITPYNLKELSGMYKWITKNDNIIGWTIGPLRSAGRYKEWRDELYVPWEHALNVLKPLVKRYIQDAIINGKSNIAIEVSNFFRPSMLRNISPYNLDDHPCGYAFNQCAVRPNGDVYFCPTLAGLECQEAKFGNIREEALPNIWYKSKTKTPIMKRKVRDIPECRTCKYVKICGGGCLANAFELHGTVFSKDDYSCLSMKKLEELAEEFEELFRPMTSLIKNSWGGYT
ncbi:radical SAM protein [Thermococcus sp.]|uniref:radical SAM/SPASM domain-containing protein n=1 Tax=Thermococcus sp. TaxID=35749 RepID=UPI002625184B|nr:radical SAM protein [Thermococcus sp.]